MFPTIVTNGDFDSLYESVLDSFTKTPFYSNSEYKSEESEKGWDVMIPFPGASKEDVNVSIKDSNFLVVEVSSKNYWAKEQTRKFKFPSSANLEDVSAEMKDGVLTLFAPKKKSFQDKFIKIK